ncbi:MAG: hypothetical protein ABIJ81_03950 [Patescibacteria group bacterium]
MSDQIDVQNSHRGSSPQQELFLPGKYGASTYRYFSNKKGFIEYNDRRYPGIACIVTTNIIAGRSKVFSPNNEQVAAVIKSGQTEPDIHK